MAKMMSLRHRVCFFFVASTLAVSTLGRSLSPRKDKSFLVISKMDIGAIVKNVRAESCDDKTKLLNFTMSQIRLRPPEFKGSVQFTTKVDVFAMYFAWAIFLDGKEVYGRELTPQSHTFKYLPLLANEIYTLSDEAHDVGMVSLPKGYYTGSVTATNQDGVQFVCYHFSFDVE